MKPQEYVEAADRFSVRLLFLTAALLSGSVISAMWANHLKHFVPHDLFMGLPGFVLLLSPLAMFTVFQVALDALDFELRLFLLRTVRTARVAAKERTEKSMADAKEVRTRLRTWQNLEVEKRELNQIIASLRKRLKFYDEWMKGQNELIEKVKQKKDQWHTQPAHNYIYGVVLRFIFMSGILLFYLALPRSFLSQAELFIGLYFYFLITNYAFFETLLKTILGMLKSLNSIVKLGRSSKKATKMKHEIIKLVEKAEAESSAAS